MADARVQLGALLPDHFDPLAAFVGAHVSQLGDVGTHLEEYAAIEREYAAKVQALVRKSRAQRDRHLAELCVGPTPQASWDAADAGNKSTVQTFFTKVLDNQEATATAHDALAEALGSVVADLSRTQREDEALLKAHVDFQRKLKTARDGELDERVRAKADYDEATQVVETQRHRVEKREASDRSSDKALKSKAAAELDMKNAKNAFLVAIATANEANAHYYAHSIPALEEGLQRLWSLVTAHLTSRLQRANQHFLTLAERTRGYVDDTDKAVVGVDAGKDQALYARFNRNSSWSGPPQWSFEPYPTFYDTPDFVTEADAHALLENRLIHARQQLRDVSPRAEKALGEYEGLASKLARGPADADVLQSVLRSQYPLLLLQLKESCLLVEDELLTEVGGDVPADARPHTFKPTTFKIPTSCAVCSSSLWGLNKQAVQCQACGASAHSKCSLRLPPECSKSVRKTGALARVPTVGSTYSARSGSGSVRSKSTRSNPPAAQAESDAFPGPTPSPATTSAPKRQPASVAAAVPPAPPAAAAAPDGPEGTALYAFQATSPTELDLVEGEGLRLVAPDEGTGWTKVANLAGGSGLVPSSYVEFASTAGGAARPAVAAGRVRAVYDFEASAPDEMSLQAGQVVELTPLGRDVAEGWVEGISPLGGKGIFPASYVEDIE